MRVDSDPCLLGGSFNEAGIAAHEPLHPPPKFLFLHGFWCGKGRDAVCTKPPLLYEPALVISQGWVLLFLDLFDIGCGDSESDAGVDHVSDPPQPSSAERFGDLEPSPFLYFWGVSASTSIH